jgi:ribonuclease BN (tRNA processing enzyme)
VRFTALGTGTAALSPNRSCAGYLLEADELQVLIDCGSGVTRRLAELGKTWQAISHILLTHFHIDHHGDLPTLLFAFRRGMSPARTAPLEIIGPPGTLGLIERLATAYGPWITTPGFPLSVREITPDAPIELLGHTRLSCHKVPHTAESVAYSMERGSRRIVYTGDTGVSDTLATWARNCSLLVCECSLPHDMSIREHLTPEQCGDLAAAAAPDHLALTHFYPSLEGIDVAAIVGARFAGPITLAFDGWSIEIEDE